MSSTKSKAIEELCIGFAEIINLVRNNNRTSGQLKPLMNAIQLTINDAYFELKILALKDLVQSSNPVHLQEGWRQLYSKWNLKCDVPMPPWTTTLIQSFKKEGKIPIYLPRKFASWDGLFELTKGLRLNVDIPKKGLRILGQTLEWMFIDFSPETPNSCFSIEELRQLGKENQELRFYMTLNIFMVFMGYCQVVYGDSRPSKICFELLPYSAYGKEHAAIVEFDNFCHFKIHRGTLPEGAWIGARNVIRYSSL